MSAMSATTKRKQDDLYKNTLTMASNSGIHHINNLSARYGLSKFADAQFVELQSTLSRHPILLDHIKPIVRQNEKAGSQLLHFAQIFSPQATLWLLSQKMGCNHQDRLGRTPLHEAVRYNNPWLFQLLISHGSNPILKDRQRLCTVAEAAYLGHTQLLEQLLNVVSENILYRNQAPFSDNMPMAVAARNGHMECMQCLIKHRAGQVNGYTEKGKTPLMFAIMGRHYDSAQWLLEQGADPDLASFQGETARDLAQAAGGAEGAQFTELLYQY